MCRRRGLRCSTWRGRSRLAISWPRGQRRPVLRGRDVAGLQREHRRHRDALPNFEKLDRADPKRVGCIAYFETTLLHARVLDEFLTVKPRGKFEDNVWAGDYIDTWKAPAPGPLARSVSVKKGQDVRTTINKQLAHLSLYRLDQAPFYVDHIADEVVKDMRVFTSRAIVEHASLAGVHRLLAR